MSKRGIRDIDLLIYCIAEERRPRRRETSAAASAAASFLTRRAGNSLEMRKNLIDFKNESGYFILLVN